ncbi:MAG: Demethylmenaquinone methyltransferase [Chlamydiae bacterium]|nr:Demethylmenaquinone methyltransferase [Chlamydiota bacterium]
MSDTKTLFGTIAPQYDRANAILSFGLHQRWNRALINQMQGEHILDLCAGTGEIAFGYLKKYPQAKVTLLDFSPEMLEIAQKKGVELKERFEVICGDAQEIPLPDSSIDGVTIAYGIRNVQNPEKCFAEVRRVLRPGGLFGILELTRPSNPLLRIGHWAYLHTLLPILGKCIAHNHDAYRYLSQSIGSFLAPSELMEKLKKNDFEKIEKRPLTGGIATLLLAS